MGITLVKGSNGILSPCHDLSMLIVAFIFVNLYSETLTTFQFF